jgi:hypothetical protein
MEEKKRKGGRKEDEGRKMKTGSNIKDTTQAIWRIYQKEGR